MKKNEYEPLKRDIVKRILNVDMSKRNWNRVVSLVSSGMSHQWNLFGVTDDSYINFVNTNYIYINRLLIDKLGDYESIVDRLNHSYTVDQIKNICSGVNVNIMLYVDISILVLDLLCI